MSVAATQHLLKGDGFAKSSHAIEALFLFLALTVIGPGRYSLDKR
jgi:putative oxidoreductase